MLRECAFCGGTPQVRIDNMLQIFLCYRCEIRLFEMMMQAGIDIDFVVDDEGEVTIMPRMEVAS